MILFISKTGQSLPIVWRLRQEGVTTNIYIHDPGFNNAYAGIIDIVAIGHLMECMLSSEVVIIDRPIMNTGSREDLTISTALGVSHETSFPFAEISRLFPDLTVIGSSPDTDWIATDIRAEMHLIDETGMKKPETHIFDVIQDGEIFLKGKSTTWIYRDGEKIYVETSPGQILRILGSLWNGSAYLLQKATPGVAIRLQGWFDGEVFRHFNYVIEEKFFMNGNVGPMTESQSNTVWVKDTHSGFLVPELAKLTPYLKGASYIGPVSLDAIVSSNNYRPLCVRISPSISWDSMYCLLAMLETEQKAFFLDRFEGHFGNGYACSQRISIPPYPYFAPVESSDLENVRISGTLEEMPWFWMLDVCAADGNGTLKCAGIDGILGVVVAKAESLRESAANVYRTIRGLKVTAPLQFRTDHHKGSSKVVSSLKTWGILKA